MSLRSKTTVDSVSPQAAADQASRTKIIYIVYLIAALDITWMFLQFSVTPVSMTSCVF